MEQHKAAVTTIAASVRHFYQRQKPFRIYHGSTNSTRPSQLKRDAVIDTTLLSHVLNVDLSTKTALVEPNVPMDRLVDTTLKYGLIPPVVMEFPGITVGGGFSGTSGESSSFKHGLFERTVNWVEMILPNGDIVNASHSHYSDLFHGAASSFGTLGVTTLLELQLINAKSHVELTYHPVFSFSEARRKIETAIDDPTNDYVDGILFTRDHGVICTGRLTDLPKDGLRTQQFSRPKDPWFYLHAQEIVASTSEPFSENIPLVDYLFRYNRGGFWVGSFAFKYFMVPFNNFTRWFLDDFLHTRVMYHALHQSGLSKRYVVQDVGIPYPAAEEFVNYLDQGFGYYPLWLCPLSQSQQSNQSTFSHFNISKGPTEPDRLLNFGIWGIGPKNWEHFVNVNRQLEHKVQELKGKKWLYAHTYYTEEEFWKIYKREEYDVLRAKYHATYLPNVYDKVRIDLTAGALAKTWHARLRRWFWGIWPLGGLYGLFHAALGGDYLLGSNYFWKRR